MDFCW
jgi:hypothetical protein